MRRPRALAILVLAAAAGGGAFANTVPAAAEPPARPGGVAPPVAISAEDVPPRGPFLSVEIAPGPYTVGDRIEAVLTLSVPAGELDGEPRFPEWGDAWGGAEVIAAGDVEPVVGGEGGEDAPEGEDGELAASSPDTAAGAAEPAGRALFRQRLELAAFRPGEVPLPPLAVAVPAAGGEIVLRTPELALAIDSVLPSAEEGAEPEPMPPAPPRPLPVGARFWWTLAAALAACLLALLWTLMRRRRAAAAAAAPTQPPFEELRSALDAARRAESPAAGHAAVSLAFRRWLGRVLRFPAAESSTAEIRRELSGRRLPEGAARRAVALLAGCDLIKFARREATAGQLAGRADAALELATEVEDYLRPAPGEGVTAGAAGAGKEAA